MKSTRPSKNDIPPPPSGHDTYCLSCGRVMPQEKTVPNTTPRKYCSASCRGRAKTPSLKAIHKTLAETYHHLLTSSPRSNTVIECSQVQSVVYGGADVGVEDKSTQPAEAREEARRAARRLVNFGFKSQGVDEERGVEAVQGGKVVESSFAKGEWGIRWSEDR